MGLTPYGSVAVVVTGELSSSDKCGLEVVIRDRNGLVAEALAVREGIVIANDDGLSPLIVESHFLERGGSDRWR